jgi:hypothetical protein
MGGDDRTNRYRLPRQRPMPKFGGDPNPFASTVWPASSRTTVPVGQISEVPARAAESEPSPAPFELPVPVTTEYPPLARPAGAVAAPAAPVSRFAWIERLNPFRRRFNATPFRPAGRRNAPTMPTVRQSELSLNAVRVVRNEFSDSEEPLPRTRLKGRQLLGRAFPRALGVEDGLAAADELPVEPTSARVAEVEAGQAKLF